LVGGLERIEGIEAATSVAKPPFSASTLIAGGKVFVPLQGILDPQTEKTRLTKEMEKAKGFVGMQEKKLQNEKFVQGAPADVVEAEREKLRNQQDRVIKLEEALADLG
jgi:valyl-tRNA synthetase